MQFKETSEEMKQTGDQVTIERLLPLATLAPVSILSRSAPPTQYRKQHFASADFRSGTLWNQDCGERYAGR